MLTNSPHNDFIICVAHRHAENYSETFIRNHISHLPSRVVELVVKKHDTAAVSMFLRDNGAKAVLAEYGHAGVAVMDACKALDIPLITHFHGYDAYKATVLDNEGRRYPDLFQISSALIAVSHDMARQLLALGAPQDKVHMNPYGVDTEMFRPAASLPDYPLFVSAGRFIDKKAPHLTITAFHDVSRKFPEARLKMIGDGLLLEACLQLARAFRIEDRVELMGVRGQEEIARTMRTASAFVQHSVRTSAGDSEGTPLAILEAGASGLPTVATRHGGIVDAVVHNETGLLVDEGDMGDMALCMQRLIEQPGLARNLGTAARRRVCSQYSLEFSIERLWSIIRNAI